MEFRKFEVGDILHLYGGSRAETLTQSQVGHSVRVRYLDAPIDPSLVGTEDLIGVEWIAGFTPAPPEPAWGERVLVVVYHVPESEESEGGYEAVTMGGTPLGVSVTAGDADAASGAVEQLIGALRVFGYSGAVTVEDATYIGGVKRYEIDPEG